MFFKKQILGLTTYCENTLKYLHFQNFKRVKLAMWALAGANILSAIISILGIYRALYPPFNLIALAYSIIGSAIGIYSTILWYNWFQDANRETTGRIVQFTKIIYVHGSLTSAIFSVLFLVAGGLNVGYFTIIRVVINIILSVIMEWYFYQVTVKYYKSTFEQSNQTQFERLL